MDATTTATPPRVRINRFLPYWAVFQSDFHALVASFYMLHSDAMTIHGSLVAMLVVASLLVFVVTFGVSVSAMSSNTLVSIAVVWMTLYGGGFVLAQLPGAFLSPERAMQSLP